MTAAEPQTVFVSGIFNILHPGHVRLLRFASEMGDRLVVGVLADRLVSDVITISENSRLEAIQSLRMVDASFIIEDSVKDAILRLRPDIVVKGREHATQENEELTVLNAYGGRLIFSSGDSFFSSTDLIHSELETHQRLPIKLPSEFMANHSISPQRIVAILKRIQDVRVLVVGDSIVDEYIACHPLGMSREDATLVVTPIETKSFIGGAAIVAAHAASVGAHASLHTVAGRDAQSEFLACELANSGVEAHLHKDDSRPTTTKQRWRAGGKTLLRVSHVHQDDISMPIQNDVYQAIESRLEDYDLLIFSDFNYGALPQSLVNRITALGKKRGMTMAADSQTSSQIGDISRFIGMTLVTPTEYEARVATRNFEDGLVVLADQVRRKSQAELVLMTLAEDGVFVRGALRPDAPAITEQLPALNRAPVDAAGAGDSLLALASMAVTVGASIHEAALLGSLAAAAQVSTNGNRPIRPDALADLITQ